MFNALNNLPQKLFNTLNKFDPKLFIQLNILAKKRHTPNADSDTSPYGRIVVP